MTITLRLSIQRMKKRVIKMENTTIEQSINDLEYYIDGLYRDSIEEIEHYRELVNQEFKTLKDLLNKKEYDQNEL